MKKYYIIILTLLALFCLPLPAAATDPSVSVSTPDVISPGEEFTVTVSVDSDISFAAAYFCPTFDEDVFTLVGGEWLIDGVLCDFDVELGDGVILLDEMMIASGNICTFTLRANRNVTAQTATVGCEFIVSDSADALIEFVNYGRTDIYVEVNGTYVTGQVTSYNPQNEVVIELVQDGETVYSAIIPASGGDGIITQKFELIGVVSGTYDLMISKAGHLTYNIVDISVNSEPIDLKDHENSLISNITLISGDVNSDGCIDLKDVTLLTSSNTYGKSYDEAATKAADINGDECFDLKDLTIITSDKNYGKAPIVVAY